MNRGVKRRDLEDVYDEFPLFDLQTFPRKTRRLDYQLYEEATTNQGVEQRLLLDQYQSVTSCTQVQADDVPIMDVVPSSTSNPPEDRALVLFHPTDLLRSPSTPRLEIKVHPDLVDDLRNYRYQITSAYTPEVKDQPPNQLSATSNLAVIPWVDPKIHEQSVSISQPMEADNDSEMMDTDECSMSSSEGLQQQPQPQHCLLPQPAPNTASAVSWW